MPTEIDAFLQRIRAFPDDDAPRLMFADWLEEHAVAQAAAGRPPSREWGEARCRFIRVQIALAQLRGEADEDDRRLRPHPDEEQSELTKLEAEEERLRSAHEYDWTTPFHGLATGAVFRRGFVEEVQVAARAFLRHGGELFEAGPIRHLKLLDIGESMPAVLQVNLLSRLIALTIYASYKGEPLARAIARAEHLSGLKALYLFRNRLEDEGVRHLAASPHLAGLEELDLGDNGLGETGAEVLAAAPNLGRLRRLELRLNQLGPVGAETIAGSDRLTSLERLDLEGNQIGNPRVQTLSRTSGFFKVPRLSLARNELRASALQIILNRMAEPIAPEQVRLRDLDLSHNPLGDNGARVLASCPRLEGLRALRLSDCGIGDEGVRALAASQYLNSLETLDLSNNPMTDTGGRALKESQQLQRLQRLFVSTLGISAKISEALSGRYRLG